MLYKKPSFTLPATEGVSTLCESSGQHAMPDKKGKCIRCGEQTHLLVTLEVPPNYGIYATFDAS